MTAREAPKITVIGGGLAGISAALECADRGARVTLIERRNHLGGLTWSFQHGDMWVDNGQHVFLRCCDDYLRFLDRIGGLGDAHLPGRLDIPVVAPGRNGSPVVGRLRRSGLPAPFHLAGSLLRYPHLGLSDRLRLGVAVAGLRKLRLDDRALDSETFAAWLYRHAQTPGSVNAVWDLITIPTVNLPSSEASLAMAAKVFKTGLLEDTNAADIGWSRVPLGRLHGDRASSALREAGVEIRLGERVQRVGLNDCADGESTNRHDAQRGYVVSAVGWDLRSDGVIVAVPHDEAASLLPEGSIDNQNIIDELGFSSIVDVHLVYDRKVTDWELMAAVNSPVQWVFDRTESSGLAGLQTESSSRPARQYLAVSMSAADDLLARRPDDVVSWINSELQHLLPAVAGAKLLDSLVTKERRATFAAKPGTARLRPAQSTKFAGLAIAGAWTETGWPATMEGAVRSGRTAAHACLSSAACSSVGISATGQSPGMASTHQEVA
ncbi:MAG TPA: hydroxysqualene dehydroxylase HpnE [Acidimicrobiales bacterium]